MRRLASRVLVGSLVLGFGGGAQAGVTEWHAQWLDNSPLNLGNTGWSWNWTTETWTVWEDYVAGVIDTSTSNCWGAADIDPIIHVVKTVTNDSSFEWTDYHVVISGSAGVGYVPGSATSDTFGTIVEGGGGVIDFLAPNSVPIGSDVTIAFDILIPVGVFTFDISQTPTPEPGSLALVGLGALLLARRRS